MSTQPSLRTSRLAIYPFDTSNASHYANVISIYEHPTLVQLWGDAGIHNKADVDARAEVRRLPRDICKKDPDAVPSHFWYLCYLRQVPGAGTGNEEGEDAEAIFVGFVGVHCSNPAWGPEVGYAFLPEYQGKVVEVLKYYREVVGLERISATPSVNNVASCRVAEKAGGVDRGRSREMWEEEMARKKDEVTGVEEGFRRAPRRLDSEGLRTYEWDWSQVTPS